MRGCLKRIKVSDGKDSHDTLFTEACRDGNVEIVSSMLDNCPSIVNGQTGWGFSGLMSLFRENGNGNWKLNSRIFQLLINNQEINIHTKNYRTWTALTHAAKQDCLSSVKTLLRRGVRVRPIDLYYSGKLCHGLLTKLYKTLIETREQWLLIVQRKKHIRHCVNKDMRIYIWKAIERAIVKEMV